MADATFFLRGEYDLLNARDLEASLLGFARGHARDAITVDAEKLRFIDSSGIGALLRVRQAMASEGRAFRVVNLPATTRRVLDALDLAQILGVERD